MEPVISVIICSYNPRCDYLDKVLEALKSQTLEMKQWELLLIDNASNKPISIEVNLSWQLNARCIREERLGLTHARLRGIQEAKAEILVFVDDDNVLCRDYLDNTIKIFQQNLKLGAIGGKSLPEFDLEPEPWVAGFFKCLALRDLGEDSQIYLHAGASSSEASQLLKHYPEFAPIGAGMALRRKAANLYVNRIAGNNNRLALGRTGRKLISGEDNDIVLTLLNESWAVGYFPQLQLRHLIPASRLTRHYLARINRASSRSWVQVLDLHSIQVWQKIPRWTILPRKIKAFFHYQAWKNSAAYVRWQGACGLFEGLGALPK